MVKHWSFIVAPDARSSYAIVCAPGPRLWPGVAIASCESSNLVDVHFFDKPGSRDDNSYCTFKRHQLSRLCTTIHGWIGCGFFREDACWAVLGVAQCVEECGLHAAIGQEDWQALGAFLPIAQNATRVLRRVQPLTQPKCNAQSYRQWVPTCRLSSN